MGTKCTSEYWSHGRGKGRGNQKSYLRDLTFVQPYINDFMCTREGKLLTLFVPFLYQVAKSVNCFFFSSCGLWCFKVGLKQIMIVCSGDIVFWNGKPCYAECPKLLCYEKQVICGLPLPMNLLETGNYLKWNIQNWHTTCSTTRNTYQ